MGQRFTSGTFIDPTRLILATYIIQDPIKNVVLKKDVLEFIYRTYIDNEDIAKRNPNVMIRNISNYGVYDISNVLEDALIDWKNDSTNGVLSSDNKYIYFDIEIDKSIKSASEKVIKMLYKKYFKSELLMPDEVNDLDIGNDENLILFGKGIYKRRVLEDMQYCPLCEETQQDNLYAVHILPNRYNDDLESRKDKNNGLLMCEEHAKAYLNEEFYFNESGFIEYTKTELVNKKMHLSLSINNKKRKKFIAIYRKKKQ